MIVLIGTKEKLGLELLHGHGSSLALTGSLIRYYPYRAAVGYPAAAAYYSAPRGRACKQATRVEPVHVGRRWFKAQLPPCRPISATSATPSLRWR